MRPLALAWLFVWLTPLAASAQLGGSINLGASGVGSGTQPAPGVYVGIFYFRHAADTTLGPDGNVLPPESGQPSALTARGYSPFLFVVTHKKILGADYAFLLAPTLAGASIEGSSPADSRRLGTGLGDLYFVPFSLGWHAGRADVTAAVGFYAPSARYTPGGDSNLGSGAWGYEISGGTTVFLDRGRSLSVATTACWELHGRKTDTERVGQILSLQGGFGKAYLRGGLKFGVAYYAQWKMTRDEFDSSAGLPSAFTPEGKHRVLAVGPDVTVPLATRHKVISLVTVRYLREFGARSKMQGSTLVALLAFPVPSMAIR